MAFPTPLSTTHLTLTPPTPQTPIPTPSLTSSGTSIIPLPRLHILSHPRRHRWYRPFSHPSLYVSLLAGLVCAVALVVFISVLVQQAILSGVESRWNIVIIVVLGAGIATTSLILILGRLFTVRMSFRSMPKPYIPNKAIDVPKQVAEHVMTEYTRTAVIAYISQPTAGKQEGWGRPGSQFLGLHFRTKMKETFDVLKSAVNPTPSSSSPESSSPTLSTPEIITPLDLLHNPSVPSSARPFLVVYVRQMEKVFYARSEPSEEEFERCLKVVAVVIGILRSSRLTQAEGKHGSSVLQTPPPAQNGRTKNRLSFGNRTLTPKTPERVMFREVGGMERSPFHDSPETYHT